MGCAVIAIVWLCFQRAAPAFDIVFTQPARGPAVVAAVLTAGAIRRNYEDRARINIGERSRYSPDLQPLCGTRFEDWLANPNWLLPSYAVAFFTRLLLRFTPLSSGRTSKTPS